MPGVVGRHLAELAGAIFRSAKVEYRLVGGLAVYLYVGRGRAGRGTIDAGRIAEAAKEFGMELRHAAGLDMLVRRDQPRAGRAIHFVFAGERVRPGDLATNPDLRPATAVRGFH
ncbi:MAG: hypothetical protein FJW39_23130 [Acidobacteria bacterium]|nr:hypothetical protein [Acidobacteriota bacterium]